MSDDQPNVRKLRISIDDDVAGEFTEWQFLSSRLAMRWEVFRDGVYLGHVLWRTDRLAWEPLPDTGGTQPSDTLLRAFHMFIGEAFPVLRELRITTRMRLSEGVIELETPG